MHPSTDWTQGQVQFAGEVSGQLGSWGLTPVDGTTLAPGEQIGAAVPPNELASPTLGYAFEPSVQIWRFNADGSSTVVWAAPKPVPFQPPDRMTMQADGNLVMRTGAGVAVWSTNTGLVGTPGNLHSYAYAASSRAGRAVYVNGLIKQATSSATLVRGAGRTCYLQRYLDGHWQNLLTRTADAAGQFAVGFIQPKANAYRLVLPRTATAASSPFIR